MTRHHVTSIRPDFCTVHFLLNFAMDFILNDQYVARPPVGRLIKLFLDLYMA